MGFFVRALPWGSLAIAAGMLAPASAEAGAPLKIGASFSNTDIYAPLGQAVHRGQRLCVKDANEKGGVLGRKIELTAEGDRSEPATALAIYERLIARDKVDAVFSP